LTTHVLALWTGKTHLQHLEAFFKALAANGLTINLEKCVFATPSLEILGHMILATGAAPTASHTAAIENCPPPRDIKILQHFLDMVNFYCPFLPKCAQILKPLTDLLKGGIKRWSGPLLHRRHSKMLNTSWRRRCPSNTLHQRLSILQPLKPPIPISEGSCSKNQETIGGHFPPFLRRERLSTLDRSKTAYHHHFSCFSPHFTQTTTPLGIHFRI
jgi:hypothetical protein